MGPSAVLDLRNERWLNPYEVLAPAGIPRALLILQEGFEEVSAGCKLEAERLSLYR